jgi:hypothetical protein
VEGSGESILDENKSMKECEKLAMDAALSNALERGGKTVIESITKVEMFQVTKDQIKLTAKVQVLEQDNSGEYGKAKRIIVGDIIKYQAKVRVKVQSIDTYNPYREQLNGMEGKLAVKNNMSANQSTGIIYTPGQSSAYSLDNVTFKLHYVPGGLSFISDDNATGIPGRVVLVG